MAIYRTLVVETYRADTDKEASALIAAAKKSRDYTLVKFSRDYKERKQKGDVVDSWYRVTLSKLYDNEKEPETFPITVEEDAVDASAF